MSNANAKQKLLQRLGPSLRKDLGVSEPEQRPILDEIIYAICRENVSRAQADAAYARLRSHFFDWNEVRVSTAREIADAIIDLPQSFARAERIIKVLQDVFETSYSFDLEGLTKKGLKPAEKLIERYAGNNRFVTAHVLQNGLGGHAIPIDAGILRLLRRLEVLDPKDTAETAQSALEHLIPKTKGPLAFEMLSALAHEYCLEEGPRCKSCPLQDQCPSAGKLTTPKRKSEASATVKSAKRQTRAH
jgi:endonuclease III